MVAPEAELILSPPRLEAGEITVGATLKTPALGEADVWFRLPEEHGASVVASADPFVLGTLQRAMAEAELHGVRKLKVRGCVSPSLLENLEQLQLIWERWTANPRPRGVRYRRVDVESDDVVESPLPADPSGAVATFSGGVDSAFTVYRHVTGRAGRATRDVRAAAIVHGFDIFRYEQSAFRGAVERAHHMLDGLGIQLIEVSTNLRDLSLAWEDEFGLYLGAVLTLLSGRFGFGLLAGGHVYERLLIPHGSTPLTDPLMGNATFRISYDGAEFDRVDKAALLGEWPAALQYLRVCFEARDKSRNCGRCMKCVFTLLCFRVASAELDCFDSPIPDEVIHDVIRNLDLSRHTHPKLVLDKADERSMNDEWVGWLRERFDQERERPGPHVPEVPRHSPVALSTEGTRPPFFAVTAGEGDVVGFDPLSRRLGPDQPFYVLQPFWPGSAALLHRTVESMARRYLRDMRKVQSHGPYLLGGRYFGALVAYETAVQLESAGESVALVAAIDSVGPLWKTRHLANGVKYDRVMNFALNRARRAGTEFGEVFSNRDAAESFVRWLLEAEKERDGVEVSRYVYSVFLARPDLQAAFPLDGEEKGHAGLVRWAWMSGRSEMEMQASFLTAPSVDGKPGRGSVDPRLRSRRARAAERMLDLFNFATRGALPGLDSHRQDEALRIANENMVRYRAGPLAAPVVLIRPESSPEETEPMANWFGIEARNVVEYVVTSPQGNLMGEPDVALVAGYLERSIQENLRPEH